MKYANPYLGRQLPNNMPAKAHDQRLLELKGRTRDVLISFEHKEGSRMVDIKDLATVVRALGVNPTPSHVAHLVEVNWRSRATITLIPGK